MIRIALALLWAVVACGGGRDATAPTAGSSEPGSAASVKLDASSTDTALADASPEPATIDAVGSGSATGSGSAGSGNASGSGSARTPDPDRCTRDSDCVFVPASCCGCGGGGHNNVVTKTRAARRPPLRCNPPRICIAMMTDTPDCTGHPACRAGKCVAAAGPTPLPLSPAPLKP